MQICNIFIVDISVCQQPECMLKSEVESVSVSPLNGLVKESLQNSAT